MIYEFTLIFYISTVDIKNHTIFVIDKNLGPIGVKAPLANTFLQMYLRVERKIL